MFKPLFAGADAFVMNEMLELRPNMNRSLKTALGLAAIVGAGVATYATITFDAESGTGFVGKGDVQYTLNLNNAQLQQVADSVQIRAAITTVTEVAWECTNDLNEHVQPRARTTTTETQGLVTTTGRLKTQITGFNLNGYSEAPTSSSTTDGPMLNSCPSGPWSLTTPAGEPVVISTTGGLQVSATGFPWTPLVEKPI
jgi:hypothetical protein